MDIKYCSKCKAAKTLDQFGKDSGQSDGLKTWCKACRKAYQQLPRIKASYVKADKQFLLNHPNYRKTDNPKYKFELWITATYTRMKHRTLGSNGAHNRGHWLGQPICSYSEFKQWALTQRDIWTSIHKRYAKTKKRGDAPSINRIDSDLGYEISNLELKTVSQNSREARLGIRA